MDWAICRSKRNPWSFRSLILVTADDIMEYDLDSNPLDPKGRRSVLERFIHGEIYKVRQDVRAVIHSHSPSVVPFGVTQVPMRPISDGGSHGLRLGLAARLCV